MLLQGKKVAIIGGGPGGLTLARLLQLKGVNVTVFERDTDRHTRIQGGALDLHEESGLAALEKAGLMKQFKANYRPGADLTRVVDNQATIHYDQHGEKLKASFGDKHHRPEIDRGPLRDILLDSLDPDTVVWNCHILSVERKRNKWEVIFENGRTIKADIVIGADGANSKIRKFVTPIKPEWTGITMIEGALYDAETSAPNIFKLLKGGKIFAYGNNKTLIVSSKGDGNFGFATGCYTEEDWVKQSGLDFSDNKQMLEWFKKEFSEWSPVWYELFQSAKTKFIPRPQYCMPLNQRWDAQADITLIGDAAHWMPPFAGEGVNMAMFDALQLSDALTRAKFGDTRSAIAHYEQKMFKRFAEVGLMTMFNTRWMHESDALKSMLQMFSENLLKQIPFLIRYYWAVSVVPLIRRVSGPFGSKRAVNPVE
jgi:2-polyprenyl-6-methoxyphenol hydroxylase-like FAD-dependent oxidoreductase